MKAIIIEDEKLSAEHLIRLLNKIDNTIEIIAFFESVKKSVIAFEKGLQADVLFVDVHLADGLSFDIFSKMEISMPVIFTTAYDEYAIKAFKLNSIDYLLKPIAIADLETAINKLKKITHTANSRLIENLAHVYQNLNKKYKSRFMVKIGDNIVSVKTDDAYYFIAEDGITLLVNSGGKRYPVDYTLDELEGIVNPLLFFRINRKVIINVNSINKVSSYFNSRLKIISELLGDEISVVSRERVNDFKEWLNK